MSWPEGTSFCPNCGNPLETDDDRTPEDADTGGRVCAQCGTPIRDGETFCVKCGAPASEPPASSEEAHAGAPAPSTADGAGHAEPADGPSTLAPDPHDPERERPTTALAGKALASATAPDPVPTGRPSGKGPLSGGPMGMRPQIIALSAVAIVLLAIVIVTVTRPTASASDASGTAASSVEKAGSGSASVSISEVLSDSYPKVILYVSAKGADGKGLGELDASSWKIVEAGEKGEETTATVDECKPAIEGGSTYKVGYTSAVDKDAGSVITVQATIDTGKDVSVSDEVTYSRPKEEAKTEEKKEEKKEESKEEKKEEAKPEQTVVVVQPTQPVRVETSSNEFVLPDSSYRYYSASELRGLSEWQLAVARNEIFARYGRGFNDADLQNHFNSCSWYTRRYSPEEFDAMASPLNDCEATNVQTILAVEDEVINGYSAPAPAPVYSGGGYVLPDSSYRLYSASELYGLSDWDLAVARNEIYARHGRGFNDAGLQNHFNSCSWYTRLYSPEEFDAMPSPLNDVEWANVQTILYVESSR